jgi:hypothetical protein
MRNSDFYCPIQFGAHPTERMLLVLAHTQARTSRLGLFAQAGENIVPAFWRKYQKDFMTYIRSKEVQTVLRANERMEDEIMQMLDNDDEVLLPADNSQLNCSFACPFMVVLRKAMAQNHHKRAQEGRRRWCTHKSRSVGDVFTHVCCTRSEDPLGDLYQLMATTKYFAGAGNRTRIEHGASKCHRYTRPDLKVRGCEFDSSLTPSMLWHHHGTFPDSDPFPPPPALPCPPSPPFPPSCLFPTPTPSPSLARNQLGDERSGNIRTASTVCVYIYMCVWVCVCVCVYVYVCVCVDADDACTRSGSFAGRRTHSHVSGC